MTEPTGNRGKAKLNLLNLLAESATLQADIGAAGSAEQKLAAAKRHIHRTAYLPDGLTGFELPFVLIMSTQNDKSDNFAQGEFGYAGGLELRIERKIPALHKDDPENAEIDFENFYEGIMDDAMAKSTQPGYFAINSWDIIDGPAQYETDEGVFISDVRIMINWGLE